MDVIGRESARIRALKVPDMKVGIRSPSTSFAPPEDFEEQIAEATFVFEGDLEPGKFTNLLFLKPGRCFIQL